MDGREAGGIPLVQGDEGARPRVAVVDDDPVLRLTLRVTLTRAGYEVEEHETGASLLGSDLDRLDVVCLDLGLDDVDGLTVLSHLHTRRAELPIAVLTSDGQLETAITAMRAGAYDYLVKPVPEPRLLTCLQRALERRALAVQVRALTDALGERNAMSTLVGDSSAMRELRRQVQLVAQSGVSVCVQGETGSGKELVAQALHQLSTRKAGPFVALNCAAIPPALQESELFGHERGAFTGAAGTHRGRFEQAHGGTLFLDELGEMSPATQATLLRTLQERTIRRVGGTSELPVDVRVISATHRDLEAEVRGGRFREDLYYRLVVYPIHVPPLRDRVDDIPALVGVALRRLQKEHGLRVERASPEALEALMRFRWPGNVRQLFNVVHRAALAADGGDLDLGHLPAEVRDLMLPPLAPRVLGLAAPPAAPVTSAPATSAPLASAAPVLTVGSAAAANGEIRPLAEIERDQIVKALTATGGNVTHAAKLLGLGRATLYRRLGELSLLEDVKKVRRRVEPSA